MININEEVDHYFEKVELLSKQSRLFREKDTERLFINLLESIANSLSMYVRSDYQYFDYGKNIKPDATLFTVIGVPFGLYEAKDKKTNLDEEIDGKIKSGYPLYNIIFENSDRFILYQNNEKLLDIRASDNKKSLIDLLKKYFDYEPQEVKSFNRALLEFKTNLPSIVNKIRKDYGSKITNYRKNVEISYFTEYCKSTINPNLDSDDILEMIIQHILTIDIFNIIYNEIDFVKYNELAKRLDELVSILFELSERKKMLESVHGFYENVRRNAINITDYSIKKKFLINFYENFYQAYNPKAADKLGIVYTPIEAVNFIIGGIDTLFKRHFKKNIFEKNVIFLDPCTGTGTFVSELVEYLYKKVYKKKDGDKLLINKFKNELFANEISILPYYIACLSIEKVFYEKLRKYILFQNITLQDTLDNIVFDYDTVVHKLENHLGNMEKDNLNKIKLQNQQKISIILGNPPYNANQKNANENNKNRKYPYIDNRIKETYVKNSNSQKTKVYDMYSRFIRYASDRINDKGMIAFITNNSFIDTKTFDGFRKSVVDEFNYIYIVNLGGNSIENKSRPVGNIFNIKLGVSISFFIRTGENKNVN